MTLLEKWKWFVTKTNQNILYGKVSLISNTPWSKGRPIILLSATKFLQIHWVLRSKYNVRPNYEFYD